MGAVLAAFAIVFLAELGDKTQLVALGFGARERTSVVLAGVVAAYAMTTTISVVAGSLLGSVIESGVIEVVGGVLFIGFGVFALRDGDESDDGDVGGQATGRGGLAVAARVCGAMVIAELGDKTMLATATLAAREGSVGVWIGGFLGITAAGSVGIILGRVVGGRLPERALRLGSAGVFVVFGLVLLLSPVARRLA